MVIQGVISKLGAIFIMIPDPVVGGIFCVMFGMITAFGFYKKLIEELNETVRLYLLLQVCLRYNILT